VSNLKRRNVKYFTTAQLILRNQTLHISCTKGRSLLMLPVCDQFIAVSATRVFSRRVNTYFVFQRITELRAFVESTLQIDKSLEAGRSYKQ
jgi:hypothetical protein